MPKPSINAPSPPTTPSSPTHEHTTSKVVHPDPNVEDTPIVVVHTPSPRVATLVSPSYSSRGVLQHKNSQKTLNIGTVGKAAPSRGPPPTIPRKPSISPPPPKPRGDSLTKKQSMPPSSSSSHGAADSVTHFSAAAVSVTEARRPESNPHSPPSHKDDAATVSVARQKWSDRLRLRVRGESNSGDKESATIVAVSPPQDADLPADYDYSTLFHRRSTLKQRNEVRRKHPAFREIFSFFESSDRSSSGGSASEAGADANANESGVNATDESATIGADEDAVVRDTVPSKLQSSPVPHGSSKATTSVLETKTMLSSLSMASIPPPPRNVKIPPPPRGSEPPQRKTNESDVRVCRAGDDDIQCESPRKTVQEHTRDVLDRHKDVDQSGSDADHSGKESMSPLLLEHKMASSLKTTSSSASASTAKRGGSVPTKRTAFADSFQEKLEDSTMLRKVRTRTFVVGISL